MAPENSLGRRTVIKTAAAVAVGGIGASTASAAETSREADSREVNTPNIGVFDGTVDRIVDGEHVVILVEAGGEVVAQVVEPQDGLPTVDEGDPVGVWLVNGDAHAVWPR